MVVHEFVLFETQPSATMLNNYLNITYHDMAKVVPFGGTWLQFFLGYMYNYGHALYNMSELAQFPFIAIWNSRSNVGEGHFMLELIQGSNCV